MTDPSNPLGYFIDTGDRHLAELEDYPLDTARDALEMWANGAAQTARDELDDPKLADKLTLDGSPGSRAKVRSAFEERMRALSAAIPPEQ